MTGYQIAYDAGFDAGYGPRPAIVAILTPAYYDTMAANYATRYFGAVAQDYGVSSDIVVPLCCPTMFYWGGSRLEHF